MHNCEAKFVPEKKTNAEVTTVKASELEEEEAYWNEYVDQMGNRCKDWLLDQLAEQMHQDRKCEKRKKKFGTVQVMERKHNCESEKLNNIKNCESMLQVAIQLESSYNCDLEAF